MTMLVRTVLACFFLSLFHHAGALAAEPGAAMRTASTPSGAQRTGYSGLPVPRFVNLKANETNARVGPSMDYPVRFVFRRKGLPLRVIAETPDNQWRKVEDHEGETMWIHQSQLVTSGFVLVLDERITLHARPSDDSDVRAALGRGVLAKAERCEAGWCNVTVDNFRGWVPQDALWGAN